MDGGGHFGWRNHFRSHFSPFQINTQLSFFCLKFTKWPPAAILDDWKSLQIAFLAISDQYATLIFSGNFVTKWPPQTFLMTENHFRSHFSPFQINTQLSFFRFFSQNGRRRPFWMTKSHFQSHFSPFQINTQLFFCFWIFFTGTSLKRSVATSNMKLIGEFLI